jgi:hypothetical protein
VQATVSELVNFIASIEKVDLPLLLSALAIVRVGLCTEQARREE